MPLIIRLRDASVTLALLNYSTVLGKAYANCARLTCAGDYESGVSQKITKLRSLLFLVELSFISILRKDCCEIAASHLFSVSNL